jgi:hypothetical protein
VRKALLLSDPRTMLPLISYREYEAVGSACRSTVILVALGKCNLWCVSILSPLINMLCVVMLSLDPLPSPSLLRFNLAPGATCCSKASDLTNVAELCCLPYYPYYLIKTPSVFPFFFTLPCGVTVGVNGFEGR